MKKQKMYTTVSWESQKNFLGLSEYRIRPVMWNNNKYFDMITYTPDHELLTKKYNAYKRRLNYIYSDTIEYDIRKLRYLFNYSDPGIRAILKRLNIHYRRELSCTVRYHRKFNNVKIFIDKEGLKTIITKVKRVKKRMIVMCQFCIWYEQKYLPEWCKKEQERLKKVDESLSKYTLEEYCVVVKNVLESIKEYRASVN